MKSLRKFARLAIVFSAMSIVAPCRGQDATQTPAAAPAATPDAKEAKLVERDRLGEQSQKLTGEGKHAEALTAAKRMLAVEVEVFGEHHAEVAASLEWIAQKHVALDQYDEAISALERRVKILQALPDIAAWQVGDARRAITQTKLVQKLTPDQRTELDRAEKLYASGFAEYEKGHYPAALKLNREALAITRRVLGEEHPNTLTALRGMGFLLRETGDVAAARPYYEEALALSRKVLGEEHPDTATSLDNFGSFLHATGDYAAARPYLEEALAIRRKLFGEDHPETAMSLNNLGGLLDDTGDYAGARPYYEQALAINRKVLGEEHPRTAGSLSNLGVLLRKMGDYAAARPYYEQALAIKRKVLGEEHPDTAISLDNLGALLYAMGDYAAARPDFEQALAIRRKALGDEHPDTANSLSNLGALLSKMGDYAGARLYYEQALATRRKVLGADHPDTTSSLKNLGVLLSKTGDYAAARQYYEQALAMRRKFLGDEHPDTADSLEDLGVVLHETGDYAAARPYLEQALAIRRKVLGEQHPDTADSLVNLGAMLRETKDYAAARPYDEQALAIRRKVLGEEHPDTAIALGELSTLLSDMGDYAAARPYCEQALAIRRKVFGEENLDTAISLINLGALLHLTGDYAAARPYYEQALAIRRKLLGEKHPVTAAAFKYLACLMAASDDTQEALVQFLAEANVEQGVLERELPSLSDAKLALFLQTISGTEDYIVQLTDDDLGRREQAADVIMSRKAIAFEVLQRRRAAEQLAAANPAVADLRNRFVASQRALEDLAISVPRSAKPKEIEARRQFLRQESNDLADRLAQSLAQSAGAGAPLAVSVADVRRRLSSGQALVEFVRYRRFDFKERKKTLHWKEGRYAAVVVAAASDQQVALIDLGPAAEIDGLVGELSAQVREYQRAGRAMGDEAGYEESYREVARKLYAKLLAPLRAALGETKEIFLGPDSRLHEIPFEALVDGSGRYLVEAGYQFAYVNGGRDLLRNHAEEPGSGVFVFAGPNYDLAAEKRLAVADRFKCASPALLASPAEVDSKVLVAAQKSAPILRSADTRLGWKRLPGADLEGQEAGAAFAHADWGAVHTYTNDEALEDLLKQVHRPKALVLVTHGDFLEDQPLLAGAAGEDRSFGELALEDSFADDRGGAGLARAGLRATEDPMLRSYLLLAGANQIDEKLPAGNPLDNGWLTAQEISQLDLRGTDLVVLSACNTSRGQADNGQAVTGMRSAFLFAGARTIVGSLYEVPNAETRDLLKPFYAGVAAGKGKLKSLDAAKLEFIKNRRAETGAAHPFYWASFVLVGEP